VKVQKLGGKAAGRGSEADEANTPGAILERVRMVAPIGVDPCWNATCATHPEVGYTIDDNGLVQLWRPRPDTIVFCNYPFSQSKVWIPKTVAESAHAPIILLSKIDTRVPWWSKLRHAPSYRARVQLDGYQRFGGAKLAATFSVALWLFTPEHDSPLIDRFVDAMSPAGEMVYPPPRARRVDGWVSMLTTFGAPEGAAV
jgi:hypothetical protein